jgi:hypothetical protein
MLVASMAKTASYPSDVDGIRNENIWLAMLGPEVYAMAVGAMTPVDPLFTQQDPIYDYCGKLVGYTSTVITGDITAIGGNPTADAQLNPPLTNFSLNWIGDRNCWGVTGVQSEQIVNDRKAVHLDASPTIEIHRGYNHTFGIPSMDISGTGTADEFFICYVETDLKPRKLLNGTLDLFNLGLARLETYELLEDANGSFDDMYALERKGSFPTGTTLYFAAENRVYSGITAPTTPSASVWWYNTITCIAQRWTPYISYGETRPKWDESAAIVWDEANLTNPNRFNENPTRSLSPQKPVGDWKIVTIDLNKDKKDYIPDYESHWENSLGVQLSPSDPLLSGPKLETPDGLWKIVTLDLNEDKKGTTDYIPKYESHWESMSPGYWTDVSDAERNKLWFGSSIIFDAPNANYLAYSNKDGSAFGLLKFI